MRLWVCLDIHCISFLFLIIYDSTNCDYAERKVEFLRWGNSQSIATSRWTRPVRLNPLTSCEHQQLRKSVTHKSWTNFDMVFRHFAMQRSFSKVDIIMWPPSWQTDHAEIRTGFHSRNAIIVSIHSLDGNTKVFHQSATRQYTRKRISESWKKSCSALTRNRLTSKNDFITGF